MTSAPFDVRSDPLPSGRFVLEASAGSGKTYSIDYFVRRYIASGLVDLDQMVIVTFTKAAAAELRARIRRGLAEGVAGLPEQVDPEAPARLERALGNFGTARISTIHGFAQRALSAIDPDFASMRLAPSGEKFQESVYRDALWEDHRRWIEVTGEVLPSEDQGAKHLKVVSAFPGNLIIDGDPPRRPEEPSSPLVQFMTRAVAIGERRRKELGTVSFDDLISNLHRAVHDEGRCKALAAGIRLILIDEFQDTDRRQWEIFDALATASPECTLIVVGDPKQSIYKFRGADIRTYSAATSTAATTGLLGSNFRSDPKLIDAFNILFTGKEFGRGSTYERERKAAASTCALELPSISSIDAVAGRKSGALLTMAGTALAPITFRTLDLEGNEPADTAEAVSFGELPYEIERMVNNARVADGDAIRDLRLSDFCVLVTANKRAVMARDVLRRAGVPAVIVSGQSVLDSAAAEQWFRILSAIARPSDPARARLAASTWFGSATWHELAAMTQGDHPLILKFQTQLVKWRSHADEHGLAACIELVLRDTGVEAVVIGSADGDRNLTDLQHVAELLRFLPSTARLEVAIDFLASGKSDADDREQDIDSEVDTTSRRIPSDHDAVSIMTVHASKGLEFPVVLLPDLFKGLPTGSSGEAYWVQRPDDGDPSSVVNVKPATELYVEINHAERRRLIYVAFTRAQHAVVAWFTKNPSRSSTTELGHFLQEGNQPAKTKDGEAHEQWLRKFPDLFSVIAQSAKTRYSELKEMGVVQFAGDAEESPSELSTSVLNVELATPFFKHSFSGMKHQFTHGEMSKEHEPVSKDELDEEDLNEGEEEAPLTEESTETVFEPDGLARGANFGKYIHEIFERVDSSSEDLESAVRSKAQELCQKYRFTLVEEGDGRSTLTEKAVIDFVLGGLTTPLGDVFENKTVEWFGMDKRLAEMEFTFSLASMRSEVEPAAIVEVVRKHLEGTKLQNWARTFGLKNNPLRGSFTGVLDLVVGWQDGEQLRFAVADYKTNDLRKHAAQGMEPYSQLSMLTEVEEANYPFQGLLYLVVLHRYLQGRLPEYSASTHLAGMHFLFVRGMSGEGAEPGSGVFSWHPPVALIEELSNLLGGSA